LILLDEAVDCVYDGEKYTVFTTVHTADDGNTFRFEQITQDAFSSKGDLVTLERDQMITIFNNLFLRSSGT
jgi:hypothetical protein